MPRNVCLLGLPAAGKTSFSRWLLETPQNQFNIMHICYDDFLEFHQQLPLREPPTTIDPLYKSQRLEIFNFIERIACNIANSQELSQSILKKVNVSVKNASIEDYIIICDDNHYYRSMRYKLYQLCKAQSYAFTQIYFECEQQLSLQRNAQRNFELSLPEHVIAQMADRLQVPLTSNIWETTTLNINASDLNCSIDNVFILVRSAFEDLSEKHCSVQLATTNKNNKTDEQQEASIIHKLDIELRRRISVLLCLEHNKESKRSKAIQLNEKRKEILQQCRGIVDLDESQIAKCIDLLH